MIKNPDSRWQGKRTPAWLKFKPEYAIALDMDAVVIGVQYGEGSRGAGRLGGHVFAEFTMGLRTAERERGAHQFVSFCRRALHGVGEEPACTSHRHLSLLGQGPWLIMGMRATQGLLSAQQVIGRLRTSPCILRPSELHDVHAGWEWA